MLPDQVLHNGTIVTCDGRNSRVSALAIWRDRICALGSDEEVLALVGRGTRIVNLGGRFVCPGFIDCHVHLTWWALGESGRVVNLEGTRTLDEALQRVKAALRHVAEGGWLRGRGWDKNHWAEARFPTAADLDAVTGDVPVACASHDGHSVWVNSAAMRRAGIDLETVDPPGGRILRDDQGQPTGVFQERAAGLIWNALPSPTPQQLLAALREALPTAAALGLTGAHNCESRDSAYVLQQLRDAGGLSLRVVRYPPAESLEALGDLGLCSGFGDEWLRIGGVKAFVDGALGAQTAAMLEPYQGWAEGESNGNQGLCGVGENVGVLVMEPRELDDLIRRATEARLAVALHAIGDRAVRLALDSLAAAKDNSRGPWPRHRIEHAQHVHPDDIPRFAQLGVIASVQPVHMLADISTCERHLGARSAWAFALGALARSGARLAMGSDAPVEVIDPLAGIRAAVLRQNREGAPVGGWYPCHKLSVLQALRGYTVDAAYAGGMDTYTGSLEVGKLADLVVLSHDLLRIQPEALDEVRVVATMVGGRVVYDPGGLFA